VTANSLVTVITELLTALLEYLDLFDRFVQSAAVKASLLPQNASIIPDSHTYLLCLKLCWHNCLIPWSNEFISAFMASIQHELSGLDKASEE